jgi:alpha-ribazole phosphatase CobZ
LKNKKKKKRKNISENISFYNDSNLFHLTCSDYFLSISDLNISDGINITKNILIFSKKVEKKYNSIKKAVSSFRKNKKLKGTYIAQKNWENVYYYIESSEKVKIISFLNTNLNLKNISNKLQVNSSKQGFQKGKLDLGQIIIINNIVSPKKLIEYYKIAIEARMKYFEHLKLPEHIQKIANNNEFLVIASTIPKKFVKKDNNDLSYVFNQYFEESISKEKQTTKENLEKTPPQEKQTTKENLEKTTSQKKHLQEKDKKEKEDDIEKELIQTVVKSCNNCLKKVNISFGILDYIIAEGVSIDALVDAGMELCVNVEKSKELRKKLKKQLLKSLEDLNVIALLMSAIRCEDDFQSNRLREVDVSNDPSYLYTDEVLGIAIANQIAGTKAIFNFKRYDEEKPGIISKLGPMVDDIFAGLVAGCMSKIFEDEY